jgi:hypothetical protein
MKTKAQSALFGAALAAALFAAAFARSDQPDTPAPPVTPPPLAAKPAPPGTTEQYKIMSLAPFQNDSDVRRIEEALNKLAADGWKVKAGVGLALVLGR